ncbi:MAG: cryptochrome/photolyase family protein [Planctomycetota bacterium]
MRAFLEQLSAANPVGPGPERTWVFVPYDQLTDRVGPLAKLRPSEAGIVMVECPAKASRRPYHRQKLFLVLANQRRFALEQAGRGAGRGLRGAPARRRRRAWPPRAHGARRA